MAANEFDFDELDKAVNSLMKDTEPGTGVAESQPATPTDSATPPVESEPSLAPETVAPAPTTSVSEEIAQPSVQSTAAAVKPASSGRFMDVVHPSSDMRAPTQPMSRQGKTIAPPVTTGSPETTEPAMEAEPTVAAPDSFVSPEPLSSPFLPDAQVEKRPLGAMTAPTLVSATENSEPTEAAKASDDAIAAELSAPSVSMGAPTSLAPAENLSPVPTPEPAVDVTSPASMEAPTASVAGKEAVLPEELSNDLVAIEAGEAKPEAASSRPAAPEAPSEAPESTTPPAASLLQSSIPQQYKEQPSTGDETHTAIYDESSAPQPLAHPPKKKKGILILIWIILILVLAVAGGAGVYYLGLR